MPIISPVIRPPAEAESFLLQITTGCSANTCSFCGAYQNKSFTIKNQDEIISDIDQAARIWPDTRRVFLMDGDALAVRNQRLVPVLHRLQETFPRLSRISSYANGFNIAVRSDIELRELYDNRLRLVYLGLESGSQKILDACAKRSSADEMVEAVRRASDAGIKSSVIVLLGLGGKKDSEEHVKGTIQALNRMQPRYLSFLSVMIIPGTPLDKQMQRGDFQELGTEELLREARNIIQGLDLKKTVFRSDHASNHLPLEGRFPQDKGRLVQMLEDALAGKIGLRPEFLRGL